MATWVTLTPQTPCCSWRAFPLTCLLVWIRLSLWHQELTRLPRAQCPSLPVRPKSPRMTRMVSTSCLFRLGLNLVGHSFYQGFVSRFLTGRRICELGSYG